MQSQLQYYGSSNQSHAWEGVSPSFKPLTFNSSQYIQLRFSQFIFFTETE